ncbi:Uncharacterized conserved protein, DUF4415 family [Phyllobacterium sp. CL33Tsu]|uniref:BrnA antitoxin family protein n=1 Tax=Phyllobacterium sp. CL33Tsu TaxID=1798191 RepID=UPI0008EB7043|nr:BrnA antitoxin family protein [Phyllobacterium sp. CL33Tsu]SFJ53326.1 Uncharacterized conserved protein, DUF4415 family [Phyllobacterium sp. CL33Tsu]
MVKKTFKTGFEPGRGFTQEDWDAVDSPPLTTEEIAQAKPFREALPELATEMDREIARRGRPKAELTKMPVTIRLDADVIAKFKATGKGWQSKINDVLKRAKV